MSHPTGDAIKAYNESVREKMNLRKKIAEWIYPEYAFDMFKNGGKRFQEGYDAGREIGYNAHKKEIADSYGEGLNEGINVGLRTAALKPGGAGGGAIKSLKNKEDIVLTYTPLEVRPKRKYVKKTEVKKPRRKS